MNIRSYILDNYNKIKNILKSDWKRSGHNEEFDEDIFHDTILKVMFAKLNEEVDDTIINYIITSFKMNVLRETLYSRVKYRTEIEDINGYECFIEDFYSKIDILKVISLLKKNFGKKYTICFILWCKGWTIKEIEAHYEIFNLYYKFGLIKKYIQDNCL